MIKWKEISEHLGVEEETIMERIKEYKEDELSDDVLEFVDKMMKIADTIKDKRERDVFLIMLGAGIEKNAYGLW